MLKFKLISDCKKRGEREWGCGRRSTTGYFISNYPNSEERYRRRWLAIYGAYYYPGGMHVDREVSFYKTLKEAKDACEKHALNIKAA